MISRTLARLKPARSSFQLHPAALLALLVPAFAWAQLAYPGYFEFHSGFVPIFNLNNLLHHPWDAAWAPAVGQPYDLLRAEGALAYRLAALLCLTGASTVTAVKWVFGLVMAAGALGMYGWARRRLGAWSALLAGLAYAFSPVVLATVTVRGALAEAVLLGIVPWLLWAAEASVVPGRWWSGLGLALGLAAAFQAQAGLALWLAAIVLLDILLLARFGGEEPARRCPVTAIAGWAAGVLLGLVGLLPAYLARGLGGGVSVVFTEHLVYPYQLLSTTWGVEPSSPSPYDTLTFSLGLIGFGLALLALLLPPGGAADLPGEERQRLAGQAIATRKAQRIAAILLLALLLLSTTFASLFWRLLPGPARTLDYPWQLLLLAAPWLAWLAGAGGLALASLLSGNAGDTDGAGRSSAIEIKSLALFGGLATLIVLGSYAYLNPTTVANPISGAPAAIFGQNEIALLDAKVTGLPGPGRRVVVTARWQALRPLDNDYTVFVHALTPDDARRAQTDTMPQDGELPTTQWRPGEVVVDRYPLTLGPDAPTGQDYRYLLGLYQWQTGQRLPAAIAGDFGQTDDHVVVAP